MSVIDSVEQQIGPSEIQQISQHLGVDEATARRAVQTALPAMVAGMAGQSQQPGGAASIEGAMGNYGNILGKILEHVETPR